MFSDNSNIKTVYRTKQGDRFNAGREWSGVIEKKLLESTTTRKHLARLQRDGTTPQVTTETELNFNYKRVPDDVIQRGDNRARLGAETTDAFLSKQASLAVNCQHRGSVWKSAGRQRCGGEKKGAY